MKTKIFMIGVFLIMGSFSYSSMAHEVEDYSKTIRMFKNSSTVAPFFEKSYGYAVFPMVGKAGFIIGGSYGEGQVYVDGRVTGKASIVEGSIGFQAGGKAFSEIIFFQDKQAYHEFISGNFEFDTTAQVMAITAGAGAKAGTAGSSASAAAGPNANVQDSAGYYKGMATFVHSKGGFMAEISIGGQKFEFEPI